ncbi:hypothetical protein LXL04_013311 [Taraxacum kok-saghyz]
MYGQWEGELWFHRRHMWSVPSPSTPSLVAPIKSSVFIDSNAFSKDGRKIHVGDCALFEPPHDSPPFVGLIRKLTVDKDDNLSLSVNWLYRPSDVKLVKGASLEAAPNEVFYSFHQDEILAASLLHPCKVAFLRKGVELPSRVSSFVCRRVYDVQTKRLWWLTDQDYRNDRQEVVNQLLDKTRVEMYGSHSPKTLNGQVKGKKREQSSDPGQLRPEDMLKAEIAKITDKGGLVDFEGVEKIIQLMQPESGDKKVDLASRIMLVNVISGTDSSDCLGRFVQLRGLLILDEWLQEFHKGKIGDGSPKEGDLSVEEFLFALLRALDKLPVNIHALQTCNVGKSVNHLRSHKNPEIIKKAKTLVDTWKKSVEAEMNMMERKRVEQMNVIETRSGTRRGGSGSWSNKSMMSEMSPHTVKQVKLSTSQPSVVKAQGKHSSGEATAKSPESPSPTKLPGPVPAVISPSDVPPVTTDKQERSSSCSPSSKGSLSRVTPERATDVSFSDNINNNNQRIIVRLPNMGRSPARTASGGSVQDHVDGRASEQVETQPDNNVVVAMDTDSCKEKEGLIGSDDNNGEGASKVADSASGKSHEASYTSINALVESCAKFSEANTSAPAGNDVGMNLLASVAAGEISRSDVSPSSCSPENKQPLPEDACSKDNIDPKQSTEDGYQSEDNARLAENSNAVPMAVEVGPAPLASDAGTSGKLETNVNDESSSQASTDKHEDEKKSEQKEKDDDDSELLTSSSPHVSLQQKAQQSEEKANTDPDSSVLLQTSENEAAQEGDGSGPPDSTSAHVSETTVKLDFDLNEIDPSDDYIEMPVIENRPTSVTVASAAKGPFLSSENLLKTKPELGWKGSAATSAFRPAEPRKPREFLDFDLNVGAVDDNPPSKYLDSRNSGGGGLDLDLNACEETPDVGPLTVNFTRPNSNIPQIPPRSGGFDLNGPGVEETGSESIPVSRNGIQFLPNVRMGGNMDVGSFHSWFPQTSTYPQQPQSYPIPQRMSTPMAPALGTSTPFNPELFRGPVLSSSPAVGFSSTTPFQFPGFPFETNFSIPSNPMSTAYVGSSGGPGPGPLCYPTMPSQLMGPLSSTYRPYVMSDNKKWGSHGLDLNSGPGGPDETLLSGLRQLPLADDQLKMFHGGSGGVFKRKEPVDVETAWSCGQRDKWRSVPWCRRRGFEAIKSATNNFADDNCIGRGGFGKVYKGELVHSKGQSRVALKRLDPRFGQGNPDDEKILVYEYVSKRSLDMYLNNTDLSWTERLKICIGAARGLAYLHNPSGTQQRVLHRDIKSSNILLDENWNAKISDLGLSKFGPANQKYSFLVLNTVGTIRLCISNNDGVHQSLIVNQLLDKTRVELYGQVKGKKTEHSSDHGQLRPEDMFKAEIAN